MPLLRPGLNISNIPIRWLFWIMSFLDIQDQQTRYPDVYPRDPFNLIKPGEKTFIEGSIDNFFEMYNYTTRLDISAGKSWRHMAPAEETGSMILAPLFLDRVENLVLEVLITPFVHDTDGVKRILYTLTLYKRLKKVHVKLILPLGCVGDGEQKWYQHCIGFYARRTKLEVEIEMFWRDSWPRLARYLQPQQPKEQPGVSCDRVRNHGSMDGCYGVAGTHRRDQDIAPQDAILAGTHRSDQDTEPQDEILSLERLSIV